MKHLSEIQPESPSGPVWSDVNAMLREAMEEAKKTRSGRELKLVIDPDDARTAEEGLKKLGFS